MESAWEVDVLLERMGVYLCLLMLPPYTLLTLSSMAELQLQASTMLRKRKIGGGHNDYNQFRSAFELLEAIGKAPDDVYVETPPEEDPTAELLKARTTPNLAYITLLSSAAPLASRCADANVALSSSARRRP